MEDLHRSHAQKVEELQKVIIDATPNPLTAPARHRHHHHQQQRHHHRHHRRHHRAQSHETALNAQRNEHEAQMSTHVASLACTEAAHATELARIESGHKALIEKQTAEHDEKVKAIEQVCIW